MVNQQNFSGFNDQKLEFVPEFTSRSHHLMTVMRKHDTFCLFIGLQGSSARFAETDGRLEAYIGNVGLLGISQQEQNWNDSKVVRSK